LIQIKSDASIPISFSKIIVSTLRAISFLGILTIGTDKVSILFDEKTQFFRYAKDNDDIMLSASAASFPMTRDNFPIFWEFDNKLEARLLEDRRKDFRFILFEYKQEEKYIR
jgi:hypothetical protein